MKFLSVIGLATIAYLGVMIVRNIVNQKSCNGDYEKSCNGDYEKDCNGDYEKDCDGDYEKDCDGGWSDKDFERTAQGYREAGYDC